MKVNIKAFYPVKSNVNFSVIFLGSTRIMTDFFYYSDVDDAVKAFGVEHFLRRDNQEQQPQSGFFGKSTITVRSYGPDGVSIIVLFCPSRAPLEDGGRTPCSPFALRKRLLLLQPQQDELKSVLIVLRCFNLFTFTKQLTIRVSSSRLRKGDALPSLQMSRLGMDKNVELRISMN